jgi:hypothetical protein
VILDSRWRAVVVFGPSGLAPFEQRDGWSSVFGLGSSSSGSDFFRPGFAGTGFFGTSFGRDAEGRRGEELVRDMVGKEKRRGLLACALFLLYKSRIAFWAG